MSTKISALPPSAGLVLTDIFPVVDDPGGTPITQKATFTQLAALLGTGNFVLKAGDTMTGALVHPVGAVGTPSITFTGDLDTGIYHPAANTVGLSAGGTLVLSALTTGVDVTGVLNVSTDLNVNNGVASLAAGVAIFNPDGTIPWVTGGPFTLSGVDINTDPITFFEFDFVGPFGVLTIKEAVFQAVTSLGPQVFAIDARVTTPSGQGQISFFGATFASQQNLGSLLSNNVTSGGTNNVIGDFTSLTVYSTDAPTIRNDIYQLARKLRLVEQALRTFGLLAPA